MATVSEKKRKLLFLARILLEQTDPEHLLTLPELLRRLEELGVSAERKSVYDDLETLRSAGLAIETKKSRTYGYYIASRAFSSDDLRKIASALRRDDSLPPWEAEEIAGKLGLLCSRYEAARLKVPASAGEPAWEKLTLEFSPAARERVERRFGPTEAEQAGKNRLRAAVKAEAGPALFAWLFLQGTEVKLVSPKKLAEQFRERAKAVSKLYKS